MWEQHQPPTNASNKKENLSNSYKDAKYDNKDWQLGNPKKI
jgi:hypothetical protein